MLEKNKRDKITATFGILVWTLIAILMTNAELELNLIVFYLLLFSIPSILTGYVANLLRQERRQKISATFIFYSLSGIILVNFSVLFFVYIFTFSIG